MSLSYHFTLEQEVGSAFFAFFGFNGTAGVWRISALNEAGGWKDRTTVEDMDLAIRATIKGWKFVYVGDVKVKSELPSTFKAYRNQQHRWSCGPAYLFKEMALEIATNKDLSLRRKFYLIYTFFFVRKIVAHIVPFTLYCIILPATIFVPEVQVPPLGGFYLPIAITLLTVFASPRSLHLIVLWIPFELAMSLHRVKATFMGLLGVGRINEWVVTEKLGDTLNSEKLGDVITTEKFRDALDTPFLSDVPKKPCFSVGERIHFLELLVGLYLCICACYDIYSRSLRDYYFLYLFLQSAVFFVAGVGYIGTFVPKS